jgi:hypothetical protein
MVISVLENNILISALKRRFHKFSLFFFLFSLGKMVNFVFHVTLNSLISTVDCANILLEMMIIPIIAINVAFAGKNLMLN